MKKAVFPGSFDPFTNGHADIVRRSINLFDEVIIGVGNNPQKKRYFSIDFMISKISEAFEGEAGIKVMEYEGLTADFAKSVDAYYLIRGLRNTTDFEYENAIWQTNKYLWDQLETVYLITNPQFASISSSLIREIHSHGRDVSELLPYRL
jgi:pantetheine-phosphate adenylyltransferase